GAHSAFVGLRRQPGFAVAMKMLEVVRNAIGVEPSKLEQSRSSNRKIQPPDVVRVNDKLMIAKVEQTQLSARTATVRRNVPEALRPVGRRAFEAWKVPAPDQVDACVTKRFDNCGQPVRGRINVIIDENENFASCFPSTAMSTRKETWHRLVDVLQRSLRP